MTNEEKGDAFAELFSAIPVIQKLLVNSIELREEGLTRSQLFILLTLARRPHMTMTQIADSLATSKEQATRAVAPLAEAGLVERESVESNRKLVLVTLTPAGHELMERKKALLRGALRRYYVELNDEDALALDEAISLVVATLRDMERKLTAC